MKKYTVKENEDLGSIAQKFGMVSWKYLYEINQETIGDNPDLLKPGTRLEIPRWDSTSGDEKIKAKDADPFKYTGGIRYRYPWVPFSVTLMNSDAEVYTETIEPQSFNEEDSGQDDTQTAKDSRNTESQGDEKTIDVSEGVNAEIVITDTNQVIFSGQISDPSELSMLLPDTPNFRVGIEGIPLKIGDELHVYQGSKTNTEDKNS